jgi:hypothetical protein
MNPLRALNDKISARENEIARRALRELVQSPTPLFLEVIFVTEVKQDTDDPNTTRVYTDHHVTTNHDMAAITNMRRQILAENGHPDRLYKWATFFWDGDKGLYGLEDLDLETL